MFHLAGSSSSVRDFYTVWHSSDICWLCCVNARTYLFHGIRLVHNLDFESENVLISWLSGSYGFVDLCEYSDITELCDLSTIGLTQFLDYASTALHLHTSHMKFIRPSPYKWRLAIVHKLGCFLLQYRLHLSIHSWELPLFAKSITFILNRSQVGMRFRRDTMIWRRSG